MRFDVLSLFPAYFRGPFDESILKRAQQNGLLDIRLHDIRAFAEGKRQRVDDRPFGGGPGMVLMPVPTLRAIHSVVRPQSHVIYLSPQGPKLTSRRCRELAQEEHLVLLCGHYEGVDERVLQGAVDEEISIGDYVLTNGCLAAIVLIDAVARFVPGVLGDPASAEEESFSAGLLDHPHYTQPASLEGDDVPQALLSGDHGRIRAWRRVRAMEKTAVVRPDIWLQEQLSSPAHDWGSPGCATRLYVAHPRRSAALYAALFGGCAKKLEEGASAWLGPFGHFALLPLGSAATGLLPSFDLFVQEPALLNAIEAKLRQRGLVFARREGRLAFQDADSYTWRIILN